jgi:hypothetical protein
VAGAEERRVRFVRIGRHVRIPESALAHRGQAGGGDLADPAGAAGDQNRLAGHRAGTDASHC